ncbi:MAG TPA: acyl carrier protein [Stellaceae bacterium]|nr:acyl carrier protein [Stellaceae bacterium]
MIEAEIYTALTEIFHEVFDDDAIVLKPELTAKDVKGWDSYKMVNIIIAVEERFGIKTRTQEIDKLQRVGDFVKLIEAKTAPRP